jgi:hypothetical protein
MSEDDRFAANAAFTLQTLRESIANVRSSIAGSVISGADLSALLA